MPERNVTLSVISHRQNALVNQLLGDVQRFCAGRVALVLTQNVPDPVAFATGNLESPVEIIVNPERKGFGANHNAAFSRCQTPYFCVCNPDIRLPSDPFPALLRALEGPRMAVAGPLVRGPDGRIEDSVRRFPTATTLLKKLLSETRRPDYPTDRGPLEVDWLAGMFMLFRSDAYRAIGGFDEAYFLYYEDVDICHRLHASRNAVVFEPRAEVVHDARRSSRRDPRLALRHLRSLLRFLRRSGFPRGGNGSAA
jgi:N-acetylglucosaminyl-diphospho-decaprenol L-rhamnosyltransferase